MKMHIQLLLSAGLLGTILTSPIPEDTCKSEMKRFDICIKKYDHGIPQWWDDSFLKKIFRLQDWKDCIGEVKCDHVKKNVELFETRYNMFVYLHINLRTCLGNGTMGKFWNICETPAQSKLPCEDRTDFDCMISKMKKHKSCNDEDVEAFNAFVPMMIRARNLFEEVEHDGRKCEGTMDEYKKAEVSKSFFRIPLSSFFDIVRSIFST